GHVKLEVPIGDLTVHEPDYKRLIAFLKAMEFNSLTRRVAEFSGVDAAEIEPASALAGGADRPRPSREAASESKPATTRGSAAPELPRGRPPQPGDASRKGRDEASDYPVLSPQMLAAARAQAARNAKFDRSKYEAVRSVDRLNAFIARARDVGLVAVDVSAAGTDPMRAELCGFSLAVAPNEACYVPLGHRQGGEGGADDLFRGDVAPDQLSEAVALEALKPLLADPGVLKIGHDLKFGWLVFALRGIEIAAYDDTILMSYAVDAGRQNHRLEALAASSFTHAA